MYIQGMLGTTLVDNIVIHVDPADHSFFDPASVG